MRDYYRQRLEAGHRAGKEFLKRNKGADRAWLGGFLEVGLFYTIAARTYCTVPLTQDPTAAVREALVKAPEEARFGRYRY
jgi:hypothetical protein